MHIQYYRSSTGSISRPYQWHLAHDDCNFMCAKYKETTLLIVRVVDASEVKLQTYDAMDS